MLHYYLAAKVSSNYFLLTLIHTTLIVLPYKNINQDFSAWYAAARQQKPIIL